jgi:hypothetical protein
VTATVSLEAEGLISVGLEVWARRASGWRAEINGGMRMHGDEGRPGALDRSRGQGSQRYRLPTYLVYFGIPPFVTAFVLTAIDPFAGLALLACMVIIWIVLMLLHYSK